MAGLVLLIVLAIAVAVTPLVAIPLAVAGQAASTAVTEYSPPDLPVAKGEWGYPLAGSYSTGRGFGYHPVKGCAYCPSDHLGYDMDQPCGVTVYAAGPGEVINAGSMPGWGNTVRIDHGGGVVTLYGHMAWDSLRVDVGEHVVAGTPLGAEGSTGKSTGCHLHYEVQFDGVAIDPEPFMAARGLPLR
ncbi:M23 family metallopeptidase [Microbacterium invictum]|uniref:Murein DD-endopeptidase MepM/ murein hydrolase activator NlpD n=1 Tax=Microbacterium invictum TaxID=515415 RepID=A0AA40SR87_9MICO|nr:M23 family metallopeptidase [Microbacterium invictum]MBB4140787.1 murein DD-endopeptidase MepM/ murein hydrolase activator NlpD [Microbacterium invictum]